MAFMDETTFRILDTLSRDLGRAASINELTKNIKKLHKTAHYKNVYDKTRELEDKGFLRIDSISRASIVQLNFSNYLLTDLLAEMELMKKQLFLEKRMELQTLLAKIDARFRQESPIECISLIKAEKNAKLNRLEPFFLLRHQSPTTLRNKILAYVQELEDIHNIKIDCLILAGTEFLSRVAAEDANPLKEMLSDQITFFSPQAFWTKIKVALAEGRKITAEKETNPAKITEEDLTYNLNRFGYSEMGAEIKEETRVCIEYLIIAILIQNDARRVEAIPILLTKNKTEYSLLTFLCKKYGKAGKLLGLLKAMNKIQGDAKTRDTIKTLEILGLREEKADEKSIREKMRLYDAI